MLRYQQARRFEAAKGASNANPLTLNTKNATLRQSTKFPAAAGHRLMGGVSPTALRLSLRPTCLGISSQLKVFALDVAVSRAP